MNLIRRIIGCNFIQRYKLYYNHGTYRIAEIITKNVAASLLGATVIKNTFKTNNKLVKDFESILKEGCMTSELKVNDLIKMLETAIAETCTKYRSCLTRQVDIIEHGSNRDPLDSYWDALVQYRVEADNLKNEFETYRSMVEYVGQLAFNLALCSALIGNLDAKDYVCNEFLELERIAHEQVIENKKVETRLLQCNMMNIYVSSNALKKVIKPTDKLKK